MSRTLSLSTEAFDPKYYSPVKLAGSETVNQLYSYTLIIKTPDQDTISSALQDASASADLTSWLGQNIQVALELDGKNIQISEVIDTIRQSWNQHIGKGTRHISGIITQAGFLYDQGRSSYYSITIAPKLTETTLRSNYRIFQDKSVIEVLRELIEPYALTVEWRLSEQDKANRYPKRDYSVQYNETDYQYFARLCSEWGINYWFEHNQETHTLILSDDEQGHKPTFSEAYHSVSYYPPKHKTTEEYLHEFNLTAQMVSGAYASSDYDYTRPKADLSSKAGNTQPYPEAGVGKKTDKPPEIAKPTHEIYQYAADVSQPEAGPAFESNEPILEQQLRSQWNLERLQQHHFQATAKGHIRGLATGHSFTLEHHPSQQANRSWVIRSSTLTVMDLAEESQRKIETGSGSPTENQNSDGGLLNQLPGALNNNQQWQIECELDLIPSNIVIRAPLIPKPAGRLQTALVVGEEQNSIQTDQYGRIKVQFHWDRYGSKDQNSSCWVRVNEPWAGNQMGAVFTPRIGQEVLIDFINNDPDLPVCIGKVNNGDNLPPWKLTENQALSGFRSRELGEHQAGNSASGRSNHLIFDDSESHIQTQLKSDHAHSSLSLGDIYRVQSNKGRQEGRGQGFELRTDDWGAARAGKGLYLSTFARDAAESTSMDAYEAQQLLDEAKALVKQLSKLAGQHQAEQLSAETPLDEMVKATASDLPKHPQATNDSDSSDTDSFLNALDDSSSSLGNNLSTYASILPSNLPKAVKAQATETILKQIAEQELTPPIAPVNPLSHPETAQANDIGQQLVSYHNDLAIYQQQQQSYEQNLPEQARQKLEELSELDGKEKQDALLNDSGIQNIFSQMKADNKTHEQLQQEVEDYSPVGFTEPVLVAAADAGLALVSPQTIQAYSGKQHSITTGGDLNISTGTSWLASIADKLSFFVYQGIKIFSGKGKIEIQAQNNNLELVADKTLKVISANNRVEVAAEKEILITCCGAYIRIKDGDIEIHAPGKVEHKGVDHPFLGPASLSSLLPVLPKGEVKQQEYFTLVDEVTQSLIPNQSYKIVMDDGRVIEGKTNEQGETDLVQSNSWQIAEFSALANADPDHVIAYRSKMLSEFVEKGQDSQGLRQEIDTELIRMSEERQQHPTKMKKNTYSNIFNWGMRKHSVKDKKYPIAEVYIEKILALFKPIDWANLYTEAEQFKVGKQLITDAIKIVFSQSDPFAVPASAWPKAECEKVDGANATFSALKWNIKLNSGRLTVAWYEFAHKKNQTAFNKVLTDLAGTLYHEIRHCQQYFWAGVFAKYNQSNWQTQGFTKNLAWNKSKDEAAFGKLIPKDIISLIEKSKVPADHAYMHPSLRILFLSIFIRIAYINKTFRANDIKLYDVELPYIKKGLVEMVKDVEKMVTDDGYSTRPVEIDAEACAEVARVLLSKKATTDFPQLPEEPKKKTKK